MRTLDEKLEKADKLRVKHGLCGHVSAKSILDLINEFNKWSVQVSQNKLRPPYYEKNGTLYCSNCGTVVGDKDDEYLFPKQKPTKKE